MGSSYSRLLVLQVQEHSVLLSLGGDLHRVMLNWEWMLRLKLTLIASIRVVTIMMMLLLMTIMMLMLMVLRRNRFAPKTRV